MTATDSTAPAPAEVDSAREAQLTDLEAKLEVRFRDRQLLGLALQHGSYGHGAGHQ